MEFSYSGYLKEHINGVHIGQKGHKCDKCEKSFCRPGVLKRHVLTVHEG